MIISEELADKLFWLLHSLTHKVQYAENILCENEEIKVAYGTLDISSFSSL